MAMLSLLAPRVSATEMPYVFSDITVFGNVTISGTFTLDPSASRDMSSWDITVAADSALGLPAETLQTGNYNDSEPFNGNLLLETAGDSEVLYLVLANDLPTPPAGAGTIDPLSVGIDSFYGTFAQYLTYTEKGLTAAPDNLVSGGSIDFETPEPGTVVTCVAGLAALALWRRRGPSAARGEIAR
jgi:hypothetical protein